MVEAGRAAGSGVGDATRAVVHPPTRTPVSIVAITSLLTPLADKQRCCHRLLCWGDRERGPAGRIYAASSHRRRSVGEGARHRISRPAARPLQTASATAVTHGQLPGLPPRRRDLLAGGRRLRRCL